MCAYVFAYVRVCLCKFRCSATQLSDRKHRLHDKMYSTSGLGCAFCVYVNFFFDVAPISLAIEISCEDADAKTFRIFRENWYAWATDGLL